MSTQVELVAGKLAAAHAPLAMLALGATLGLRIPEARQVGRPAGVRNGGVDGGWDSWAVAWVGTHGQLHGLGLMGSCMGWDSWAVAWAGTHGQLHGLGLMGSCMGWDSWAVAWAGTHGQLHGLGLMGSCMGWDSCLGVWVGTHVWVCGLRMPYSSWLLAPTLSHCPEPTC
jgi:hypothetical protein